MNSQQYQDSCLIIVGDGGATDELLARRRLAAGGRLVHVSTGGLGDERVKVAAFSLQDAFFSWMPPPSNWAVSTLGKRLGARSRGYWTKSGPDAFDLPPTHTLQIIKTEGSMRHIYIIDSGANIQVELSGQVVLNPTLQQAQDWDVTVVDPYLKPFGTFTPRRVLLGVLVVFVWHFLRWLMHMQLEANLSPSYKPWWRPLPVMMNGILFCGPLIVENLAASLCGEQSHWKINRLANIIGMVALITAVLASDWRIGEFPLHAVSYIPMFIANPLALYKFTMNKPEHSSRHFSTRLRWALAQVAGVVGCAFTMAGVCMTYAALVAADMKMTATIVLPVSTTLAEQAAVTYTRTVYRKFVWAKRCQSGNLDTGDHLFIPVPMMISSAHSLAEAVRLVGSFAGAVKWGSMSWIPTIFGQLLLNLFVRLGWAHFAVFGIFKRCVGEHDVLTAMSYNGFIKLHDHMKIFGGYFRFIAILGLGAARAAFYGLQPVDSVLEPFFNSSATYALLAMMILEGLEDAVVLWELLPMAPVPREVLRLHHGRDKTDPDNLLTIEYHPCLHSPMDDPWRPEEISRSGSKTKSGFLSVSVGGFEPVELIETRVSLGPAQDSYYGRLRRKCGQLRSLNPPLALHGLREMPFHCQLCFIAIVSELTSSLLTLMLGAGYLRGIKEVPCEGFERVWSFFSWDRPLAC
ncbi:unnamed protein product [Symbiodinium natans]|uniref:Uncharacterized protein n=1 Tax=Symbiodinium natans TaxID=878477 RepID=A0A812KT19_9DINO|nr:unnamed protein product [Symbiodinium natans]